MLKKVKAVSRYFSSFNVSTHAASASFFIVLSIFPMMMLVLSLLRYLPVTPQDLLDTLDNVLPEALLPLAEYLVNDLYSTHVLALVSVTVLVALWSASRGVYGILGGINAILGSNEHRSYLRRRFTALIYTFLLILALLLTLGLQVFSKTLLVMVARWDIRVFNVLSELVRLRLLFTTALLALLFTMIYAFFPAKKMHLRDVLPSAAAVAVGWMVFSYLFSIYVDHGGSSRFYGSMTLVVLSMLWLYICMCMLFYGGVLCRLSEEGRLNLRAARRFFFSS